ncbi:MAG: carbohydrate binding domain-containing protein [Polyangiaceae bacterium]|nr:carbohydrate binding domain-containing protein [Polyangiaceae bacterium]
MHRRLPNVTSWLRSPLLRRWLARPTKLALLAALPAAAACNAMPERAPYELECNPYPDIEVSDIKFAFDELGESDWYNFTDNTPSGMATFGVKDLSEQPHGERCDNTRAFVIDSYGYNDWGAGFTTWTLRQNAPVATGWDGISFWARTIEASDRSFTLVLQDRFGSDAARITNPETGVSTETCRPLTSETSCTLTNMATGGSRADANGQTTDRPTLEGWSSSGGATLAATQERAQAGLWSMVATGSGVGPLTLDLDAAEGGVGASPINGQSYDFFCWVTLDGADSANVRLTLTQDCGDGARRSTISEVALVSAGRWRKLKASYTVPTDCAMNTMQLSVEGSKPVHSTGTIRLFVDNVFLSRPCCSNDTDDDGDGRTDAEDTDCVDKTETECDDGIDNDGDGGVDCGDLDCCGHAAGCGCDTTACANELFCKPDMDVCRPNADGSVYFTSIPRARKKGHTAATQNTEGQIMLGGTVLDKYDCGHEFNTIISTTKEWQLYLVPFDDLRQVRSANWNPAGFDRSGLWSFVIRTPREAQMELWLDDVAFYRHLEQ